jgi:hypothetical protein
MLYRIKAAWRVLRGELIAVPRAQTPSVWYMNNPNTTSANPDAKITWNSVTR